MDVVSPPSLTTYGHGGTKTRRKTNATGGVRRSFFEQFLFPCLRVSVPVRNPRRGRVRELGRRKDGVAARRLTTYGHGGTKTRRKTNATGGVKRSFFEQFLSQCLRVSVLVRDPRRERVRESVGGWMSSRRLR